jgi:ABC-type antimicrobial peptide transport system permease subunit
MLGTFLALLAAGVLGHALTTTTRRRRGDLAALRAVGMTRRQSGMIVLTQATVLAIVGLAIGVPLGIALGRVLWRIVADSTPLAYRPPVTALALALVVPAVFLTVNLIAAPAARRAARLRVAEALRSE